MNEDLDYNFNEGSGVIGGHEGSDPDAANLPIIKKRLLDTRKKIKELSNVNSLDRKESLLTLQQQLDLVEFKVAFLRDEELDLAEKVKELSNGR